MPENSTRKIRIIPVTIQGSITIHYRQDWRIIGDHVRPPSLYRISTMLTGSHSETKYTKNQIKLPERR